MINSQWDNVTVCLDEGCSEEKERRRKEGERKEGGDRKEGGERKEGGDRKKGGERRMKFPQLRC